jgi:hypothetical protein
MDFAVSPPGCGWSVTDFLGWDAHEAQLRCPDEVDISWSGYIYASIPKNSPSNLIQQQTAVQDTSQLSVSSRQNFRTKHHGVTEY